MSLEGVGYGASLDGVGEVLALGRIRDNLSLEGVGYGASLDGKG